MTARGAAAPAGSPRLAAAAAAAAGLYASTFYIAGNATMLTPASSALVAAGLTLPVVVLVVVASAALVRAGQRAQVGFAAAFLSVAWLLFTLRVPVFQAEAMLQLRARLPPAAWPPLQLAWLVVPALLAGFLFRRSLGRLAAILCVMAAVAIALGIRANGGGELQRRPDPAVVGATLDRRPDIYFILADSFGSLAYLESRHIDTAPLRGALQSRGFRVYDDAFANYHATADSMLSMLDMRHHYYLASRKLSEVSRDARRIVGGDNDLVRVLRANGYRTEYVHQGNYLLLQGCSADACFPSAGAAAGAGEVLRRILPSPLSFGSKWGQLPFAEVRAQLFAGARAAAPGQPVFRYVHLFEPGHASNAVTGRCDESAELAGYAVAVEAAGRDVETLIDDILRQDRDAVVVVSGDHGPMLANRCDRDVDISTLAEYRDRTGVLMAIRWPGGYDGRFDARIRSNVNVFRYLLASLQDGAVDAVGGRLRDDVFVHGSGQALRILDDGRPLYPPERLSREQLRALYARDPGR